MDVGLTIVVATMIFLPAFAALYQAVTKSRRKNRWAPGLARRLDEGLRVERDGFTATVENVEQPVPRIRVAGPFAAVTIEPTRGGSSLDGSFDAGGDPALLIALLDAEARAAAVAFVRAGGTLDEGGMSIPHLPNDDSVVENTRIALDLAVRLREDPARLAGRLLSCFRDRSIATLDRRRSMEWIVDHHPSAPELLREVIDDDEMLLRSLARLLSPGHRMFHVAERDPAELAGEIARTRTFVRSQILESLAGIGEPAESVLAALLVEPELRRDATDPDRAVEELEALLEALAYGGTPRVFEALHTFAASRPPGGTRLVRGANEAIARIRERHPESGGGQLSVVDSSAAGALSETAEPGALSEVDPPARTPRKQET